MKLDDLKEKKLSDLREVAKTMSIEKVTSFSKDELIAEIMKNSADDTKKDDNNKETVKKDDNDGTSSGVLEILPDGYGFR